VGVDAQGTSTGKENLAVLKRIRAGSHDLKSNIQVSVLHFIAVRVRGAKKSKDFVY
jgi:hypothetical protein